MTEAIRRILWLLPVLAVGAVLLFFALASTASIKKDLSLPLFYNAHPQSAQGESKRALKALKSGHPGAELRLFQLGGAALPTLLEKLPTMGVKERRNVVRALSPVARRMNIIDHSRRTGPTRDQGQSPNGSSGSDDQLLFWQRYRVEHALDLRPLSVTRLVRRMAQRDARLQSADLFAVDTYALPTLMTQLGRIHDATDVARSRRIVSHIAYLTGENFEIPLNASLSLARIRVSELRRFWDSEGAKWTQLDRFTLLVGRISQTEFANWIFRSTRALMRLDPPQILERAMVRGRVSFPLFSLGLFGVLILGPALAASIQVLELRYSSWKLERWGLRGVLALGLIGLSFILVRPPSSSFWSLLLSALLAGTIFSAFTLHRELSDRLNWRTHHVLSKRARGARISAVSRWLAPTIPTLTPIAVAETALWVTCLESGSGFAGIGSETLVALRTGDLDFLMLVCLGLGLVTGGAQVGADILLGSTQSRRGLA